MANSRKHPNEKLIGSHVEKPDFFYTWLSCEDLAIPTNDPNKKHRKLTENTGTRDQAIEQIAEFITAHHVDLKKIQRLRKKKDEILEKYDLESYTDYLDAQTLFPKSDKTQKGNVTEIILSNYLQATTGLSLLAYRLHYSSNVEQPMKGDDCLLINKEDVFDRVLVGEAKFRGSNPDAKTVKDAIENLEEQKRLPISLPFLSKIFSDQGNDEFAGKLEDLSYEISLGNIDLINVGFLLSTKGTSKSYDATLRVEDSLETSNPSLVFISLGVEKPGEIVKASFKKAYDVLKAEL